MDGSGASIHTDQHLQLDTWYFVAMTWDGFDVKVYIDGVEAGSRPFSIPSCEAHVDSLVIGRDSPGLTEYMNGIIDDVRIYNRALSEADIQQLFAAEVVVPVPVMTRQGTLLFVVLMSLASMHCLRVLGNR